MATRIKQIINLCQSNHNLQKLGIALDQAQKQLPRSLKQKLVDNIMSWDLKMLNAFSITLLGLLVASVSFLFSYLVFPSGTATFWLLIVAGCGFYGTLLPYLQQPGSFAYRLIRFSVWIMAILMPLHIFFYRVNDLVISWAILFLLVTAMWWLIDMISLRRDYSQTLFSIVALPASLTFVVHLILTQMAPSVAKVFIIPNFLAASLGYLAVLFFAEYLSWNSVRHQSDTLFSDESEVMTAEMD